MVVSGGWLTLKSRFPDNTVRPNTEPTGGFVVGPSLAHQSDSALKCIATHLSFSMSYWIAIAKMRAKASSRKCELPSSAVSRKLAVVATHFLNSNILSCLAIMLLLSTLLGPD